MLQKLLDHALILSQQLVLQMSIIHYMLNDHLTYNVLSTFEELIVETILTHDPKAFVTLSLFYDGKDIEYKVKYSGEMYNPIEASESISMAIFKNNIKEYSYQYHDTSANPNSLKFMSK